MSDCKRLHFEVTFDDIVKWLESFGFGFIHGAKYWTVTPRSGEPPVLFLERDADVETNLKRVVDWHNLPDSDTTLTFGGVGALRLSVLDFANREHDEPDRDYARAKCQLESVRRILADGDHDERPVEQLARYRMRESERLVELQKEVGHFARKTQHLTRKIYNEDVS